MSSPKSWRLMCLTALLSVLSSAIDACLLIWSVNTMAGHQVISWNAESIVATWLLIGVIRPSAAKEGDT